MKTSMYTNKLKDKDGSEVTRKEVKKGRRKTVTRRRRKRKIKGHEYSEIQR